LDVLIHNAGIAYQGLLTDTDSDTWHALMGVHLDGAYHCCKAVIPTMVGRQSGVIVTVSSMWGITGASCEVAYSAAKAGLIGFTKALAKELGPSKIRVNCVAPGVIDTDMCAAFDEETRQALCEETPLGKMGTAEDVAESLLFLASEKASFITGQVLGVNGGFLI
jgi:3-oxoacyl-[acyl-carrier protein] reductase